MGGVRARPVRPVVRLLRRRQLHPARNHRFGRDDRVAARRVRPRRSARVAPAPKPKPAPKPTPALPDDAPAAARDPATADFDRARTALSRATLIAAGAVAAFVSGCVACAWVEGAPLVPADAGRADGGSLGGSLRAARPRIRRVSGGARACPARRAECSVRSDRSGGDPADPAGSRCWSRPMRGRTGSTGGSRRSTTVIPTSTRRTSSPTTWPTRRQVPTGATRPRSTARRSHSSPRSWRSSRPSRRLWPRGSSRLSPRWECSPARCSRRASRATAPTRRRSSAGTRSLRSTSPAAGTTTRF